MAKRQKSSKQPKNIEKLMARVNKKIKPASELPTNFRALVYGRPGCGKTRLCASAPDVLWIDINEKGWDSIRRDYDPKSYPVEFWHELDDVFWFLQSGEHPFRSVAVDGVTAMQVLCMKFVLGDEASRDASRDPDMPSRQVWGKVGELMKTQITNFRNLPMNVIFTARERSRQVGEDEEDMEFVIGPNISPGSADYLEGAVPLIGHLTQQEVRIKDKKKRGKVRTTVRRRLLVGPSEKYITKERYGVFGPHIDSPDITEMIEAVYGKEEG